MAAILNLPIITTIDRNLHAENFGDNSTSITHP